MKSTALDITKVGLAVVQDPALPEVTRLLVKLVAIENEGKGESSGGAGAGTERGIGLRYAVTPLRYAIRLRQDPWLVPLVGGGLVAAIFLFGVATGRPGRRRGAR